MKSLSSQCRDAVGQSSCKAEQKVKSLVYCGKLAVTAMTGLTPANCSRQMQQSPGRLGSSIVARKVRGATSAIGRCSCCCPDEQ